MSVDVKVGNRIKRLAASLEEKLAGPVEKAFSATLEELLGDIIERTQSGKDYRGRSFKAYSKSYKAWKNGEDSEGRTSAKREAARAKGKVARGSTPNLTLTGAMLDSLRSKVQKAKGKLIGTLFVLPSEANKAKRNQKTRPFFGLSDKQIKQLRDVIKEAMLK